MTASPDTHGPISRVLAHPAATGGPPDSVAVLLHGLGADGADLMALAPVLADALPTTEFLAPDAPFPCDMAPFGRQWFSLLDRDPSTLARAVTAAAPALDAFLDHVLANRGLDGRRLMLLGFSQGCMMALQAGLRRTPPPAAVVGFSGALLAPPPPRPAAGWPPVLLIHGTADPVVPFAALAAAESALRTAGAAVDTLTRPGLGHGIDDESIDRAAGFLAAHLKAGRP